MSNSNFLRMPSSRELSKFTYLQSMLSAFQKFEYTRSPQVLKSYMKKNRDMLNTFIQQLNQIQLLSQSGRPQHSEFESLAYKREKQLNEKLQKQYANEVQVSKGVDIRESQARFNGKFQQMETTLYMLNRDMEKLNSENQVLNNKLEKQRFYRQWQVMHKQHQGAKALNIRLKAELQKKKAQIANLSKQ